MSEPIPPRSGWRMARHPQRPNITDYIDGTVHRLL